MSEKLNVIDLFAGCGGLSDGFDATKIYNTLACVEWEKEPCKTLKKRLKEKWGYDNADEIVLHFDIQRTDELINGWNDDINYGSNPGLKAIVGKNQNVDLVIGGPPCQAYSVAGRIRDKNSMHDDYRNFLFESYLNVVASFKPKAFVFENVPGMLSAKPGGISIIERVSKAFCEIGYEIIDDLQGMSLINCTDYGVPQSRKRLVIIGINREKIDSEPQAALRDFYLNILPTYKSQKINTVKDAIYDLPKLTPLSEPIRLNGKNFSHSLAMENFAVASHIPRMHSPRDIEVFKILTDDIETGQHKYAKADSLKELYFEQTGRRSNIHKYHVLKWNKPSNTIPAHLYKDGLRHIHPDPEQARSITVREAARLQSFDDDFDFTGSSSDQYKMIGNAVPPKLARALGLAVKDFLLKYF